MSYMCSLLPCACVCDSPSALKSISQTISSLYPFWTSLQILGMHSASPGVKLLNTAVTFSIRLPDHLGHLCPSTEGGPMCEETSPADPASVEPSGEGLGEVPAQITGLAYDQRMMEHHNMWDR